MRLSFAIAIVVATGGDATAKLVTAIPAATAQETAQLTWPGDSPEAGQRVRIEGFRIRRPLPASASCRDEPLLTGQWTPPTREDRRVPRQMAIDERGLITNILFLTQAGWRRYDPSVLAQVAANIHYQPATRDGKPVSCWFEEDALSVTPTVPVTEQPIATAGGPPPGVIPPKALTSNIVYPTDYPWETGDSGGAVLKILILSDGSIGDVAIMKSSGSANIDQAAVKLVHRWLFSPATKDGTPVAIWIAAKIVMRQN